MKKIFLLVGLSFGALSMAQENNRFAEAEQNSAAAGSADAPAATGIGNPGDPVPVDAYVPFLVFAGAGIIIYAGLRKKLTP